MHLAISYRIVTLFTLFDGRCVLSLSVHHNAEDSAEGHVDQDGSVHCGGVLGGLDWLLSCIVKEHLNGDGEERGEPDTRQRQEHAVNSENVIDGKDHAERQTRRGVIHQLEIIVQHWGEVLVAHRLHVQHCGNHNERAENREDAKAGEEGDGHRGQGGEEWQGQEDQDLPGRPVMLG